MEFNLSDKFENRFNAGHYLRCGCAACKASAPHSNFGVTSKKEFNEIFKEGDVVYVKHIKDNFFKIPSFVILSWIITFPLIWFCNAITG